MRLWLSSLYRGSGRSSQGRRQRHPDRSGQSPTLVRTASELDAMRNDLYGWYVLDADIDLSGMANWIPVGEYEADYEFAPGEWWRHAFKGVLDGNGRTIKGLTITELVTDKSGLFGTVANGEIRNLRMEGSRLTFTAERPYVAPLAGILKQDEGQVCSILDCPVINTLNRVKTNNAASVFHSFLELSQRPRIDKTHDQKGRRHRTLHHGGDYDAGQDALEGVGCHFGHENPQPVSGHYL